MLLQLVCAETAGVSCFSSMGCVQMHCAEAAAVSRWECRFAANAKHVGADCTDLRCIARFGMLIRVALDEIYLLQCHKLNQVGPCRLSGRKLHPLLQQVRRPTPKEAPRTLLPVNWRRDTPTGEIENKLRRVADDVSAVWRCKRCKLCIFRAYLYEYKFYWIGNNKICVLVRPVQEIVCRHGRKRLCDCKPFKSFCACLHHTLGCAEYAIKLSIHLFAFTDNVGGSLNAKILLLFTLRELVSEGVARCTCPTLSLYNRSNT